MLGPSRPSKHPTKDDVRPIIRVLLPASSARDGDISGEKVIRCRSINRTCANGNNFNIRLASGSSAACRHNSIVFDLNVLAVSMIKYFLWSWKSQRLVLSIIAENP